jgi:hypothetical protein
VSAARIISRQAGTRVHFFPSQYTGSRARIVASKNSEKELATGPQYFYRDDGTPVDGTTGYRPSAGAARRKATNSGQAA